MKDFSNVSTRRSKVTSKLAQMHKVSLRLIRTIIVFMQNVSYVAVRKLRIFPLLMQLVLEGKTLVDKSNAGFCNKDILGSRHGCSV